MDDPIGDIAGTYFATLPDRANVQLIRNMASTYAHNGKVCHGTRYNYPDGWTRLLHLRYDDDCWRITVRSEEIGLDRIYTVNTSVNRFHWREMAQVTVRDGVCIKFNGTDPYILNCRNNYSTVAALLCPTDFPSHYPYHEIRQPIQLATCYGTVARGTDGRPQELELFQSNRGHHIYIYTDFAPYRPNHFKWETSRASGTITLGTVREFAARVWRELDASKAPTFNEVRDLILEASL